MGGRGERRAAAVARIGSGSSCSCSPLLVPLAVVLVVLPGRQRGLQRRQQGQPHRRPDRLGEPGVRRGERGPPGGECDVEEGQAEPTVAVDGRPGGLGWLPDGRLLVFEVDNIMIVHDMDPDDIYPYKKPIMEKVFSGFQTMLAEAAGR